MNKKNHSNSKFTSGVEIKYENIKNNLRRLDRRILNKEDAESLAYKINEIERYGFKFHPNVYVWDSVEELNQMTRNMIRKQKERKYG